MFQPDRNSPPISPMARMTWIILITINEDSGGLSLEPPYIRDQLIDLRLGEFLFESRHFVAAVADRIEKTLVGHFILPGSVGKIARMDMFRVQGFRATIFAVARAALRIERLLGVAWNFNPRVRSRGVRKNEHHCDSYNRPERKLYLLLHSVSISFVKG